MQETIVSIIICTYNQEVSIGRTIDAIVGQDCRVPFEVIIGNDCSTDGTRSVCEGYVQRYPGKVRLLSWESNKGVLQNYYDCVREARGEYIMECGGDDEWCPGRINLCLDAMESNPGVVQVYTDVWLRNKSTGMVVQSNAGGMIQPGIVKGSVMSQVMFNHWPAFYAMTRRNCMLQLMEAYPQFFTGREYLAEDHQLAVLMGTKGDAYYIPQSTYYYDQGESISVSAADSKLGRFHLNMLSLMCELSKVVPLPSTLVRKDLNDRLYKILMHAFRSHDSQLRRDAINDARRLQISPFSLPVRLCMAVTSCRLTWLPVLYLRRFVVFIKSLSEKRSMS